MLSGIIRRFWPEIDERDVRKFSLLTITFVLLIGAYWMFRLLKDTIFFKIAFPASLGWAPQQGSLFQPIAKTISVFIVATCVIFYSKLVDKVKKQKLYSIVATLFTIIFTAMTSFLIVRNIVGDAVIGKTLLGSFGWFTYFATEAFASIVIHTLWGYINSTTSNDSAKIGYPIILTFGQLGAIAGSTATIFADKIGNIWPLFAIATTMLLGSVLVFTHFIKVTPEEELVGNIAAAKAAKKAKKPGFFDSFLGGLKLLLTKPYLMGVLVVSTMYEIVGTIVDYQMKRQAALVPQYATEVGYAKFLGYFGVATNTLAFFVVLMGTATLLKKYGVRVCLLVFPACLGIAMIALFVFYQFGGPSPTQLLWATFGVMMIAKGLSYAVNNPTKEMMYIPTSKDAKLKAKGWIDMFGARSNKVFGAQIVNPLKHHLPSLMLYGTLMGLGITGIWIIVALLVGQKNRQLIKDGEIIE